MVDVSVFLAQSALADGGGEGQVQGVGERFQERLMGMEPARAYVVRESSARRRTDLECLARESPHVPGCSLGNTHPSGSLELQSVPQSERQTYIGLRCRWKGKHARCVLRYRFRAHRGLWSTGDKFVRCVGPIKMDLRNRSGAP